MLALNWRERQLYLEGERVVYPPIRQPRVWRFFLPDRNQREVDASDSTVHHCREPPGQAERCEDHPRLLLEECRAEGGRYGDHFHDTTQWQAEDQATVGNTEERRRMSSGGSSTSYHRSHCAVQDRKRAGYCR